MKQNIFCLPVVESRWLEKYVTVQRAKGTPDKNKPNSRRPLFKKTFVTKTIPCAYIVNGVIYAHPDIAKHWKG